MKILVTGASGFVGSHLCERLLHDGHFVFALVRTPKNFVEIKHQNLTVIKGDLDQDVLPWVSVLPEDLDTCIHTAGLVHAYNTNDFFRVNSDGTENLVNSLRQRFQSLHFILVSSLAAAGPTQGATLRDETDMDFPISIYGRSKKKAEVILSTHSPHTWIISAVRPPMVIGPRDTAVLDIFKMVKGGLVVLPGTNSLKKRYSFVCVFDLVETLTLITTQKKKGLFYSASSEVITFQQLIQEVKKQLKKRWIVYLPFPQILVKLAAMILHFLYKFFPHKLRLTPDKYFELTALNWTCNAKKSEDELGQVYYYNLERTVTSTLVDYKNRKWI